MEFYKAIKALYIRETEVSIPNGMEFYLRRFAEVGLALQFQFPTGWNSTAKINLGSSYPAKFQFPTGWNSTLNEHDLRKVQRVSIPNGMEFYSTAWKCGRFACMSFNSQRDGILLISRVVILYPLYYSFNSQRDGILLRLI